MTRFRFNVWKTYYMECLSKKTSGKKLKNWREKNLENQQEFVAWNFLDPKSPKISMSVIVIVCRNKFYKCRIFVKILLLGRLNKFLLVINLTGYVFFWISWISENWNEGVVHYSLGKLRNWDEWQRTHANRALSRKPE